MQDCAVNIAHGTKILSYEYKSPELRRVGLHLWDILQNYTIPTLKLRFKIYYSSNSTSCQTPNANAVPRARPVPVQGKHAVTMEAVVLLMAATVDQHVEMPAANVGLIASVSQANVHVN